MKRLSENWHLLIWVIAALVVGWGILQLTSGDTFRGIDSLTLAAWIWLTGWLFLRLMRAYDEINWYHDRLIAHAMNYRALQRAFVASHGGTLPEEKELQ